MTRLKLKPEPLFLRPSGMKKVHMAFFTFGPPKARATGERNGC